MMRVYFVLALLVSLSGCTLLNPPNTSDEDARNNTTMVDAVEGDKSEDNSALSNTLRSRDDAVAGDPAWAPIEPKRRAQHYAAATGSLFNQANVRSMYDDSKPRSIGDIITVTLDESTKAAKSANADLTKKNDAKMEPLDVGGRQVELGAYNLSYQLKNSNSFAGDASAKQSNSISGYITVEVIDVLANGNLVIRGEKWMTLNTGDEYIRLSGTIRPDDINFDNTIASNRVSNARIQYSGTGTQKDMQEPGFLARFFNVAL